MPLTPLPEFPESRKDLSHALNELEQQLTLTDAKLYDITSRFLFEYNKGLNHVATASDSDSFLPQMCALFPSSSPLASTAQQKAS